MAMPSRLVTAYRDEGLSLQECAERFGRAKSTIHFWLQRAEVIRRAPGRPRELAAAFRAAQGKESG